VEVVRPGEREEDREARRIAELQALGVQKKGKEVTEVAG